MKTIAIVIASLMAFSGISHAAGGIGDAADITAPVKEIMEVTRSNWADNNSDWTDIFDASRLDHLYSRDFVAKYRRRRSFPPSMTTAYRPSTTTSSSTARMRARWRI